MYITKKVFARIAISALLALPIAGLVPLIASADTVGPINFESPYVVGDINGQDGWLKTGAYDVAVTATGIPTGFGTQSLRISDAITSGAFGDQTFAKPLVNAVGETSATAGTFSVGTRQSHFEMQFDIASVLPTLQTGMHVSVSPDRGDGSRMSYLRFEDQTDGIHVFFDDVTDAGPLGTVATFNETDIATISRSPHTIKLTMDLLDGPSNDVVKVYVDGVLKITGTSWEDYYRFDPEAIGEQSPRIVKTVLFRESGMANPANLGNGFIIDNLILLSGPSPVVSPSVVNLGTAGNFAILSESGITDVPTSTIIGNVGTSPIAGSAITGLTCPEVSGTIYTVNAAGPVCRVIDATLLDTAVGDMETAYTYTAGLPAGTGAFLNVGAGILSGQNLVPGIYTWNSTLNISGDITLTGSATDVWVFQVAGTLDLAVGKKIILAGGALPQNIFWQVSGAVTLLTGSTFEGNILAKTNIAMQLGAVLHGRALAQTAVTLIGSTISAFGDGIPPSTPGTISGMKYNDLNRNGKKNTGEIGLAGWTINLERVNGSIIASVVTDANGNYSFTNLSPGTYKVREVHQNGWKRMSKNPKPIVLVAGANVINVSFGNAQKHKGEKEDTDKDDRHDDQSGDYKSGHGRNNYENDQDNKDHQSGDDNQKGEDSHH